VNLEPTPTHEAPPDSFGRYLQARRLEKGLGLEELSKAIRVRADYLAWIEEENHGKLPEAVFVAGFIRAFARAVGADPNEALRRYQARRKVHEKASRSEQSLAGTRKAMGSRLYLSLALLVGLIAVSILTFSLTSEEPARETVETLSPPAAEAPEKALSPPGGSPPEEAAGSEGSVVAPAGEAKPSGRAVLRMTAVEETWLKLAVDDREPREFSLGAGDRLEFEAEKGFDLLIGNAGGVELFLNDRAVEVPGKKGQVVRLRIPAGGSPGAS